MTTLTSDQFELLTNSPLFRSIPPDRLSQALSCLGARVKACPKGSRLFEVGVPSVELGFVLSGGVELSKEDYWGNRILLGQSGPGQIVGEVYACLPDEPMDVTATAVEDSLILFLRVDCLLDDTRHCTWQPFLSRNLIAVLSRKTLGLTRKIEHSSKRTIRLKVLSYLSTQATHVGSPTFTIPYNRQGLADYLAVDRSALSAELSRMSKEGLITVRRNHFTLHAPSHRQ